jgi:hypothetical protein
MGDGEPRRHVDPAPLQVEQQIAPVLRALAGAIGEADQFLAGFRRRADQHQDALLSVFDACLEMDAIGPDVDVALSPTDRASATRCVRRANRPSGGRWPMPATWQRPC